jgi:predicted RecB family nuclease
VEKHLLSKSTFIRGLQCRKSLFLYKHYIQLRDPLSNEQKAIFNRGNNVGILAQGLFPGGTDASPCSPKYFAESVAKTKSLIESGAEVIYEAAFQYDRVLVALDILVKREGKWLAYEVKSSSRISPTYILDASLQSYVINKAGLPLEDFFLVHLNTGYVRKGPLELHKLFSMVSVKKQAAMNESMVEETILSEKETLALSQVPDIAIGEQCFSPYNCDFMGQCWKNMPEDSVFSLSGIPKSELFALYNNGVKRIVDIDMATAVTTSTGLKMQIDAIRQQAPIIDKPGIKKFLDELQYPLFFLDFETTMPAVPMYEGNKP